MINKIKNLKKLFLFFAILAVASASIYFVLFKQNSNVVEVSTMSVYRGNITKTINLTGVINSSDYEEISLIADVKVLKTYVKENDQVKSGQLLAELDSTDILISLKKAEITLSQLNSDLIAAKNGSSSDVAILKNSVLKNNEEYLKIKNNLQTAKENLEKSKILFEENAISKAEYEKQINIVQDLESSLKVAELNYNDSNSKYADYFNDSKETVKSLQNQIKAVKLDIENLNYKIENNKIYSSVSGIVTDFPIKEGRKTSANSKILIYDTSNYEFTSNVAQDDAVFIKEGQKALISVNGIQNSYEGIVVKVGKIAQTDEESGSKTPKVEVVIKLNNPDDSLSSGFDAECKVKIDSVQNALVIKNESVKNDDENKNYAYILENNKANKVFIQTGLSDGYNTDVLSGIKENDIVIVNPPAELSDDVQVKVAD